MELLLRLVPGRSLGGLFLAGDPQQVINPSGFRSAECGLRAFATASSSAAARPPSS